MFEGLVQNLLLGYLGSYINNIQKDQLKIGPWSGEVKLNDLELNLEAFDNLQLPFSLNQGRVGTLSIKIPWKKLGWDPIEISLDKVFIRACERDEHEWSVDSVGKREYATKKAKLHAAEMAKPFVSEAKTWQSFLPHITAKILDGIQVSITDVRFIFTNKQSGTAPFLFGLRFSSLKLERNNVRSYSGKLRGGEVNKSMVISCLKIYCNACQGTTDDISEFAILEPCDVTVSLMVNKSGQLDGSVPQYSVNVVLTSLVLQINEIQMHQLLTLSDYLGTCHLREKYGRFRPSSSTLFSKPVGWQKLWWHYVQESVLLDIRKKLRKTSWRYLGWRISYRRKYVNLYKEKLNFIRQAQPMDKDILLELEQMEKDSDIDDILTYRSIAERESQEILGSLTLPSLGKYSGNAAAGVQQIDENSLLGSRGWINWLSLGMLGAGGVDNSSQFSGVVSDEIVKDIYEVTQFHPLSSVEGCALTKNGIFLFSIKFNVQQINATLLSKKYDQETVKVVLDEVNIIFKLWEESWNVLMFVKSVEMDDLCTGSVILLTKAGSIEENFLTLEVDMSSANHEPESTVKAVFEPFEFTYGSEFLLNLWDFFDVWGTFQFHSKRVLASLNGFDNENVRIMSKAEYIFLNRTNIIWDVRFSTFAIKIPWLHENSQHIMVLELGSLKFRSSNENNSYESMSRDQHTTSSISYSDKSLGVKVGDLYDHFETELANFKVNVVQPDCNKVISIIDRCGASFTLASCIIPDESVLEQLKVHILVSSLCLHFSPSIYGALLEMSSRMDMSKEKSEPVIKQPRASFGISVELKCVNFHVNLSDKDEENSSALTLALCEVYILYSYQEDVDWRLSVKTVEISSRGCIGEGSNHLLCSSRSSVHQSGSGVGIEIASNGFGESSATDGKCFVLHCQAQKSIATDRQEYNIDFNGLDLHIYPNIVGMLLRFFDRLSGYDTPAPSCKNSFDPNSAIKDKLCLRDKSMSSCFELKKFGFSNFCDDGPTTSDGIPFDHFPFVTIQNSGSLSSLIQSLLHGCTQWNPVVPRQRKCGRCLGSCFKNRQGMTGGNLKSLPDTNFYPPSKDSRGVAVNVFDLNLNGINVYFHDTSCILGTLTLPFCKSLFVTQGEICLDILCSVDGLELSSAWATKNFGEFLWGYSVPNLSPVLNIRFRKNGDWTLNPNFEISFSVQHVCCILPPEFLAILIGYFTMPAWSSRGYENSRTENHKQSQNENPTIIWKVEILNSRLIIPVECNKRESLHLGLQQLYFSFTTANDKDVALKDIPLDCMVPSQKIVNCVHLLNIFGRNACLSLALLKNEGRVSERLDHDTSHENFSIISSLDIDLWIRLPCDNMPFGGPAGSTCIMSKVDNCQVIAEDEVFLIGVEALLNVIDDFSKVGREAEGFRSDIFHFVQFKKTLRESNVVTADTPYPTFKDIRFNVHSLSLLLYQSRQKESGVSELVAQADMQFQVSASFKDDVPLCLDVVFSGLVLNSLHSSVILVQCSSDVSNASVFHIHLAKSHRGVNILVVDMPSVHIWLHLSDWSNVIGLLVSYSEQFAKSSFMNPSPNHLISATSEMASIETIRVHQSDLESTRGSDITFYTNTENSFDLIIRSENLCVSLHYPLLVDAETLDKSREAESDLGMLRDCSSDILGEAVMLKGRHRQYVTLALHIREYELSFSSGHANLICCVEEARGVLDNVKDQRVFSSSFFQLFQVNVVVECDKQQTQRVNADIRIDSMDVSVSHQLFHIWYSLGYQDPEAGSSTYSFFNMDIKMHLRKVSLLLTDWTCSCNGPILEILLKNLVLHSDTTERSVQASIASDLLVNYFNTHKVVWEPFIETWNFLLSISRIHKQSFPLKTSSVTDIHLTSTSHLNMNITEPIVEVIFRANELIKRVQCPAGFTDPQEVHNFVGSQSSDGLYAKRYAPYTLQNETSLPFLFQLHRGLVNQDEVEILSVKEGNVVYPGSSVPIYTDETPEEQFLRFRPPQSSDRLNEKKSFGVAHHFISIQLDGTCGPSRPISVDIVGLTHFEVNFSKALPKEAVEANDDVLNSIKKSEEHGKIDPNSGFVVPVVFDVSTLHYRKLIRVYSTVMLLNTTSMTLELQFDTPFGVSPKAQYQIASGEEFPLPLHLAEAGRMRWRPFKSSFLWSEAHTFSKVLSQETKLGYFRSFICYPSFPSGDSFHCCLSIQLINLASASGQLNSSPLRMKETPRHSVGNSVQSVYSQQHSKTQFLHYVTLTTPLLVRNYMPRELSLTIESRGDARTVLIPEVNCASIFHIDSSHDLGLVFHVDGFSNSTSKFPCAEAFVTVARFHENKFSQSETLTFYPDSSKGPIYVTLEKTMDGLCGARELCIFVPFLLYNCTGLHITVADMGHEMEGCTMPPCDHLIEMDQYIGRRQSPILLSSKHDSYSTTSNIDSIWNVSSKNQSILLKEHANHHSGRFSRRNFINVDPSAGFFDHSGNNHHDFDGASSNKEQKNTPSLMGISKEGGHGSSYIDVESKRVKPCMYFPHSSSSASELMVRLSICLPKFFTDNEKSPVWSSPFYLIPASGSSCVVVPQADTSGAFIVSVTSSPLSGPFSGRTRAITFQPRYLISNACSKDLCYKQKGSDLVFHLGVGQHSHLHWADPSRELLVSLVFNEPGWLWSGSFFPDHLGDTQVKMRNYEHGSLSMIRVEVQNADAIITDEKVGIPNGNSGTVLILLSDDNSGFMPYRIDNFSNERLRIYQENCKTFETTIHSYMSCLYTWDEPCSLHCLVVEVLGERILGSFALDDVTEQVPVYLPSTSEKPARQLYLSIHADGAVKVLSIVDSSYLPKDMDSGFCGIKEKRRYDQKEEIFVDCCESVSVHIPFIGVSLIDAYPQELLFASAIDTRIDLLQSVQQQKVSFQISSLQVDNQLHNTVLLSLDHDRGSNLADQVKNEGTKRMKDGFILDVASQNSCQPVISFSALKWRNKDISFVCFDYIILRLAALRLELEEEVILCLFDFMRSVSKMQSGALPCLESTSRTVVNSTESLKGLFVHTPHYASFNLYRGQSFPMSISKYLERCGSHPSLPSVVPIEDFWEQIYLVERKHNRIFVEVFILAPIKLTLSFSSAPWVLRDTCPTAVEYPRSISGSAFQRGLMALADVEGAPVYLKQLTIAHHMGTTESFNEILIRHYTPQLLHEMYKIFGSASVIGNPMGFAKNLGLGIKDFISVPATGILKSPSGLFTGVAHGTTSLFYRTVYATSNAATQFSKSVHKSIVALTFDDQAISTMEKQWTSLASHSTGVLHEFLEGLTGFLQSPIRGAEKHGLPGVFTGIVLGTAGLVTRPVASILEVTGKTAQSIRNRSILHESRRHPVRPRRLLNGKQPLQPYIEEEEIGKSILLKVDDVKFKEEIFVTCRELKKISKFLILTERFVLIAPDIRIIPNQQCVIEFEMSLKNVIYIGKEGMKLIIVGINSETPLKQHHPKISIRTNWWSQATPLPLFQMKSIELDTEEEAEYVLRVLVSVTEQRSQQSYGVHVLHRSNLS